ncbi:MAG TPA: fumarate hydratase [Firmicutes bacterium]|jgi:fumarate hydratase subunit alpha|nr:fumarate hydratase [Bacillota bacterium]HAW71995.1 fumarate hydratase [Bacillota bacterium]HAZ23046.1 fumarate hydratase [Bacillota bacterium]HBE06937.1 fumarate hydratase [Bacillota bacterium]HBG43697.1 fumarate hydratase [Bacillota bacterium]
MAIRSIAASQIENAVYQAALEANTRLPADIMHALEQAETAESSENGRKVLRLLLENARLAAEQVLPICQDTGVAIVFADVGQEVHLVDGEWESAINRGIAAAYRDGSFRCSMVADPLQRANTGDNTPALIHWQLVPGSRVTITVMPKGFGSENMSRVVMLVPSDGIAGIRSVIIETVKSAGPNACPPLIVGVGIGGTQDHAALLAKKALLRPIGVAHPGAQTALLEQQWLGEINDLGIGPGGFGGNTTALALHIETYATHIAGLPVAVQLGCHALRRSTIIVS